MVHSHSVELPLRARTVIHGKLRATEETFRRKTDLCHTNFDTRSKRSSQMKISRCRGIVALHAHLRQHHFLGCFRHSVEAKDPPPPSCRVQPLPPLLLESASFDAYYDSFRDTSALREEHWAHQHNVQNIPVCRYAANDRSCCVRFKCQLREKMEPMCISVKRGLARLEPKIVKVQPRELLQLTEFV